MTTYSVRLFRDDKPGDYVVNIAFPPRLGFEMISTFWAVDKESSVNLRFRFKRIRESPQNSLDFEVLLEPYNPKLN